ncbi:uncharacterized protein K460DRAFT_274697 [Cucurbitaria berberidis CBS 394.84]|uniref:KOW domain-containing protein n=1 Tax=Cucurbitaria berberidis CBS 394.84 TaxID=1168544 RepID=A0A9P4GNS8_9PLEO|nr:uncharacterized protein K460DRAFT_274697 [Cucurbitaria berberidis CBS 394.84]KAF1849888.1 hypothetical protein K460DRAFT_274697 [Cucurbitaria berberidis CBS 394.84]
MSQLIVRPGRNAARQAKKLKEMRKVKGAIVWHEKERKKRQEIKQERWESKQAVIQRIRWENEHVKGVRDQALRNAKEDWQLGPLRPNRAVGEGAEKYGAVTSVQMQKPEIPTRSQKNRNEFRERKGLELEYPLVVDNKKYFPIVKDDRVVVLKGRDKGKIGVVQEVIDRTHEIIVKGINMQYYDSNVFNASSEDMAAKHENEVPLPLADVRLVIPYELTQHGHKRYSDVIVDKIFMERHTTGIDPYTGTDYGDAEIPENHQYDPQSGLPIFHRYIAGTHHRIEWPWEREEEFDDIGIMEESAADSQTWFRKTMGTIRHPITSLKSWRGQPKQESSGAPKKGEGATATELELIEQKELEKSKTERPRSKDPDLPDAYDNTDTTRNIVEGADSMSYTILAPPFPDTLGQELRGDVHDFAIDAKKDPEAPRSSVKAKRTNGQGVVAREVAKERKRASERMKTPMQLRWELEHAKKLQAQKKSPLVETDALLMALGQHMQKNGVKPKRSQATEKAEDLD